MHRTDPDVGIRRKRQGWQAYVSVYGRLYTKQFPLSASRATMQRWRTAQRAEIRATVAAPPVYIEPLTARQRADVVELVRRIVAGEPDIPQPARARVVALLRESLC